MKKKGKGAPPPNVPDVGDRCQLRGRAAQGTVNLIQLYPPYWTRVAWDDPSSAPKICHLFELEKI